MATQTTDLPLVRIFSMIRSIDHDRRKQMAELLPAPLTVADFDILRLMDSSVDGLPEASVHEALHYASAASVQTALEKLAASGFIKTSTSARSSTSSWIEPTSTGRAIYAEALIAIRPQMDKLREAFTAAEMGEALQFLDALHTWFVERDWT